MKIRWFGHACFGLIASDGRKILMDPFDESVGYPMPQTEAAAVTVSHGHYDHSHTTGLPGNPAVLREPGVYEFGAMKIRTINTFHDNVGGKRRGANLMFQISDGELHVLHAGDLGHVLSAEQILACGRIDVLMLPIGGTFTIAAAEAAKVVEQLKPRLILPMHYRTDALAFPLAGVEPFLEGKKHQLLPYTTVDVIPDTLPAVPEIWVLSYA